MWSLVPSLLKPTEPARSRSVCKSVMDWMSLDVQWFVASFCPIYHDVLDGSGSAVGSPAACFASAAYVRVIRYGLGLGYG